MLRGGNPLKDDPLLFRLMRHSLGIKTSLIVAVVAVVIIAVALAAYLVLTPHVSLISVNAPYTFIISENDQWYIAWYDQSGNLHALGPYRNLNDPNILQAMIVVNQFNAQVVPQHSNYQPLTPIIVIEGDDTGKQGIVAIPVFGGTIELKNINPAYYTIVVVPNQYTTQFMHVSDTGYEVIKIVAYVTADGLQYLQYNDPEVWHLVLETGNLQSYSPQNVVFVGEYILLANNTLIPYGFLNSTSSVRYGNNLPLVNTNIPYNGEPILIAHQYINILWCWQYWWQSTIYHTSI